MIRRLATALTLAALIVIAAAPAAGDDGPTDYQPDGTGLLFEKEDLRQGHDPTLYEKYPDGAWGFDYKNKGLLNIKDNIVDGMLNGGANFFFALNRSLVNASITLHNTVTSFDAGPLNDRVETIMATIGSSIISWLLPSALVIGAIAVLAGLARGTGQGLHELGAVAACAIVAISIVDFPHAWMATTQAPRHLGAATTATMTSHTVSKLNTPFAGPTPTFGNDQTINAQRQSSDAIWRTYVAQPWCLAEFGNYDACQAWGEDLLDKDWDDRAAYITQHIGQATSSSPEQATPAFKWVTGHGGAERLTIAFFAFLASLVFCGCLIFLCGSLIMFMLLIILMLTIGAVFLMLGCIPGRPRQWATDWAWRLAGFCLTSALISLVLAATIIITMIIMSLTGTYGWGICAIFSIIGSFSAIVLFRHTQAIIGTGPTGFAAAIGSGLGIARSTTRALTRRRRQRQHQPSNTTRQNLKPTAKPTPNPHARARTPLPTRPDHAPTCPHTAQPTPTRPTRVAHAPRTRPDTVPQAHPPLQAHAQTRPARQQPHHRPGKATPTRPPAPRKHPPGHQGPHT